MAAQTDLGERSRFLPRARDAARAETIMLAEAERAGAEVVRLIGDNSADEQHDARALTRA